MLERDFHNLLDVLYLICRRSDYPEAIVLVYVVRKRLEIIK
jgi:hypothetical protein